MDSGNVYSPYYSGQVGYSQVPYYMEPGYPQGQNGVMVPMSIAPQEQQYAMRRKIDVEAEMAKEGVKAQNRMAVNEHKIWLDMQKTEHKTKLQEEAYERRCLTVLAVSENSDGYFEIERISPDGSRRYSAAICDQRGFQGMYFHSADSAPAEDVLKIIWQGEEGGIILSGAKMTSTAMCRELAGKGICFRIPRRERIEIMEKIWGYILGNAKRVEVPRTIGWTQNSKGAWQFEAEIANTLEGMKL